jgi:hypothetical protein
MKTQKVINHQKRVINMNIDTNLWRQARIKAAEKDTTLTTIVEHCLREGLNNCRHDEIK